MKIFKYKLVKYAFISTFLSFAGSALAQSNNSDQSVAVIPAEGNVQCKDYADNKLILSASTSKVAFDAGMPGLSGPENPVDPDSSGESIIYDVIKASGKPVKIKTYTSSTPINYVVLKSGSEVNIFLYGTGGVSSDGNLALASGSPISAISFCYGLPGDGNPPEPPELPDCDLTGGIDQTVIMCPADGSRAFVCNFEPDKEFFGLDDGNCCFCNHGSTKPCDPELPVGEDGACPVEGADLIEVPSMVEAVKNPGTFYCLTLGGRRICYSD